MPLSYIQASERMVGQSGSYPDTLNRALRGLLQASGYDPDATTFPGLAGPVFNVQAFGASPLGALDARAAFVAADTGGTNTFVPAGIYRIASNLTLTQTLTMAPGGIIKPDAGVTVTIVGAVSAGFEKHFDLSLGGVVLFGASQFSVRGVREVPAAWFGQVVGEQFPAHDAIQNALDSLPYEGGRVLLLPGWNYHRKPIRMRATNMQLVGAAGAISTILRGSYFGGGYQIVIGPPLAAFPTEAALATGTGSAMTIGDGVSNTYWIDLRESFAAELNGLAQLGIDFYFKPRTAPGNRAIITSRGRRLISETMTTAFGITQINNNSITAWMTIGGVLKTLTSPAGCVPLNTATHVALTYDGTTLRLFCGGVLQNSVAATGTVTQALEESVYVGLDNRGWPQGGGFTTAADAGVDSLRLSDTARFTGAFAAPTAKFAYDANTLVLCNFDQQFDQFTKVIVRPNFGNGEAWLNLYRNTYTSGVTDCVVDGIHFSHVRGGNVLAFNAQHTRLRNLYCESTRMGLTLWNNSYLSDVENVQVYGGAVAEKGRWGLAVLMASGVVKLDRVEAAGTPYPLIFQGSSVFGDAIYVHGGGTKNSMLLIGDNTPLENMNVSLTNVIFSDEDMTVAGFDAHLVASYLKSLSIGPGCMMETSLNSVPMMRLDACRVVSVDPGAWVRSKSGSTEIINIVNANVYPVQIGTGVTRTDETGSASVPWSTTVGAVLDNSHGDAEARRIMRPITAVAYSASMTPDASLGDTLVVATNGTAFTINTPTNLKLNQEWELTIKNTSGGALGAATFPAIAKMAAWTQPATGFSRAIRFRYDGTNLIEKARTTVDIPN